MRLFLNEKEDFLALFMFFRKSLSDQICCANGIATGVKRTQKISHIKLWVAIIHWSMPNVNKGLATNKEWPLFDEQRQPRSVLRDRFAEREIQKLSEATKV